MIGWQIFEWREKEDVIGHRASERARTDRKEKERVK
jgi:hypothetical protein